MYEYDDVALDVSQWDVILLLAVFALPVVIAWVRSRRWWPVLVWRLESFADRVGKIGWAVGVRLFSPLSAAARRVVAWYVRVSPDTPAKRRRELGVYLASLPPHSGLTYYEEMANDIAALPAGPAKVALQAFFRDYAKPPSADCVAKARCKRGKPRVNVGVVRALLRGELPYYMNHE